MDFEKLIQDMTTSLNVGIVLDSVKTLCENGLRYKRTRICTDETDVAEYNPEKRELRIFDSNELEKIDKSLFKKGLKEVSEVKVFRFDTICTYYAKKRLLRNVEGFISKLETEGW